MRPQSVVRIAAGRPRRQWRLSYYGASSNNVEWCAIFLNTSKWLCSTLHLQHFKDNISFDADQAVQNMLFLSVSIEFQVPEVKDLLRGPSSRPVVRGYAAR